MISPVRNACRHIHAEVNTLLPRRFDQPRTRARHRHRERIPKRGLWKCQLYAWQLGERARRQARHLISARTRRLHTQLTSSQHRSGGQDGNKALVGTNIGRRFFTPNVLFAGGEDQQLSSPSLAI